MTGAARNRGVAGLEIGNGILGFRWLREGKVFVLRSECLEAPTRNEAVLGQQGRRAGPERKVSPIRKAEMGGFFAAMRGRAVR